MHSRRPKAVAMVKADWEWVTREGSSTRGRTVCDKIRRVSRVGPWTHERSTPHGVLKGIPPSKIRKRETDLHLPAALHHVMAVNTHAARSVA